MLEEIKIYKNYKNILYFLKYLKISLWQPKIPEISANYPLNRKARSTFGNNFRNNRYLLSLIFKIIPACKLIVLS